MRYHLLSQVAEYDQDREETLDRLEKFKTAAESQHSSEWKVQQKDEEVKALQKAISDLQVCLFQEREQVRVPVIKLFSNLRVGGSVVSAPELLYRM